MCNYSAKVVKIIDEYSVVVNKGANDGIVRGTKFLLVGIGEEITDPDTMESLGNIELVRGQVKVEHVQERMATLISNEWTRPVGTRTIKRRNPFLGVMGSVETEIVKEQPEVMALKSPEVGDVIKERP